MEKSYKVNTRQQDNKTQGKYNSDSHRVVVQQEDQVLFLFFLTNQGEILHFLRLVKGKLDQIRW